VHIVLQNSAACAFLAVLDPNYPKQARDVIDDLTQELREVRDLLQNERMDHQFIQQHDRGLDWKVRAELLKWKRNCAVLGVLNLALLICLALAWGM